MAKEASLKSAKDTKYDQKHSSRDGSRCIMLMENSAEKHIQEAEAT